jgi:hypothetical protein
MGVRKGRVRGRVSYSGGGFVDKKSRHYGKRDVYRLPKKTRAIRSETRPKQGGLGNPLGEGFPRINPIRWRRKNAQWAANRETLRTALPKMFTKESMAFFNALPSLGGGREGTVRVAKLAKPIKLANGNVLTSVVIKKFEQGVKAGARTQARTLYSLHRLMQYFVEHGVLKRPPFDLSVIETVAHHGNFLFMINLSGRKHTTAQRAPQVAREKIYNYLSSLCKAVTFADKQLLREMTQAGLELPNLDLKMDNIICTLNAQGNVTKARIIDQSAKSRDRRYRNKSLRILNRASWKLPTRKR